MQIFFATAALGLATASVARGLDVCDPVETDDPTCDKSTRIVGGTEVCPPFKYSHLVPLGQASGSSFYQFCGATLYDEQWLITAAHCVDGDNAGLAVQVHRHDLTSSADSEGAETINVVSVASHPHYNSNTQENDVAVLKLDSPVSIMDIPTITLDDGSYQTDGQMLTVAGWGTLSSGGESPGVPHEVDVPYVTYQDCTSRDSYYSATEIDEDSMICAGNPAEGGTDSCQGDSGGPLFVQCDEDEMVLVGVVSWGYGCASIGYPGIYAKVSASAQWIMDVIDGTITGEDVDHDSDGYVGGAFGGIDCIGQTFTEEEANWIGDGLCDDGEWDLYFNCEEFECDAGDCEGCSSTLEPYVGYDCDGVGYYEEQADWVGDGYCDDGTWDLYFDCAEFSCDGGDCDASTCATSTPDTTTGTPPTTPTTTEEPTTTAAPTTEDPTTTESFDDLWDAINKNSGSITLNANGIAVNQVDIAELKVQVEEAEARDELLAAFDEQLEARDEELTALLESLRGDFEAHTYEPEPYAFQTVQCDGTEYCNIQSVETCNAAAVALEYVDTEAKAISNDNKCYGCQTRLSNTIVFNSYEDGPTKLGDDGRVMLCQLCEDQDSARQLVVESGYDSLLEAINANAAAIDGNADTVAENADILLDLEERLENAEALGEELTARDIELESRDAELEEQISELASEIEEYFTEPEPYAFQTVQCDGTEYCNIQSVETCDAAAVALEYVDTEAKAISNDNKCYGCQTRLSNTIVFNSYEDGPTKLGDDGRVMLCQLCENQNRQRQLRGQS